MATAEKTVFAPTHTLDPNGISVMRNPDWVITRGPEGRWIDSDGNFHRTGAGSKAYPIENNELPAATKMAEEGAIFGVTYARVGEVIPSEWWRTHNLLEGGSKGVMITREAAGAALRASAWPDSDAPCGHAGDSHDDDATFEGKDKDGNCIVKLFIRSKGFVRLRIPRTLFFEVVE